MPEIAEVETVRRTLKKQILNKRIIDVKVIYDKIILGNKDEFKRLLIGRSIKNIKRIGKWLMFDLGDYYLCSHLRMEGKYFIKNSSDSIEKHEHIIISFSDNTTLRYHDTRKFGRMSLVKKTEILEFLPIKKQGIEANSSDLTDTYLFEKINKKNIPIKTILLDQSIISGLGNIYANEVLFASLIHPLTKGCDLTLHDCKRICDNSKIIIDEAIKMGGTTIKSYTSSLGVSGRFQQKLCVHKKEGMPCIKCKTLIENIKVGGRSTYFCPKCQGK